MGTREKIDRKKRLKEMLGLTDEGMSIFNDALHEVATKEKVRRASGKFTCQTVISEPSLNNNKKKQLKKGITYKDYSMRTDVLLKEKCKEALYKMLPYNELFFEVYTRGNQIKVLILKNWIKKINKAMFGEEGCIKYYPYKELKPWEN